MICAPARAVSRAASGYHWSQQTQTPMRPNRVSKAREAQVARREVELLVVQRIVGNVHLAIHARRSSRRRRTPRPCCDTGPARGARTANRRHHAVLARRRGQRLARGPGNRLRLVEAGVILALAGILAGEQFLQADDVGAGRGGLADAGQRLVDVALLRRCRPSSAPAPPRPGWRCFADRGSRRLLGLCCSSGPWYPMRL